MCHRVSGSPKYRCSLPVSQKILLEPGHIHKLQEEKRQTQVAGKAKLGLQDDADFSPMISMVPSGLFKHFKIVAYDHRTVMHLKNTTFIVNYINDVFCTLIAWIYSM